MPDFEEDTLQDDPEVENDAPDTTQPPAGKDEPKVEDKGEDQEPDEEEFDPFAPKEEEEEEDPSDAEGEMADDDRKIIDARVRKHTDKLDRKLFEQVRNAEVDQFLASPEGKLLEKYGSKIRELSKHDQLKRLKVEAVAAAVVGTKTIMKLGAQREQMRGKTSAASSAPGSTRRPAENTSGLPDFAKMSAKEIEDYSYGVISGKIKY